MTPNYCRDVPNTCRGKDYLSAIYHWPLDNMVFDRAVSSGISRRVYLRVPNDAPVKKIFLRTAEDGEERLYAMKKPEPYTTNRRSSRGPVQIPGYSCWHVRFTYRDPDSHYRFIIVTEDCVYHLNESGINDITPIDAHDFRYYRHSAPPEWVYKSVFYNIFPDRFARSGSIPGVQENEYEYLGNTPTKRAWHQEPLTWEKGKCLDFFNGDLEGIRLHLDYLQNIGVNSIWLNPIFSAPSNHRYDTADYMHVDSHIGGDRAFLHLLKDMRRRDMKVVLDGVFNHTGIEHFWFNNKNYRPGPRSGQTQSIPGGVHSETPVPGAVRPAVPVPGAVQSTDSPYLDHYIFDKYPDDYHCWLGVDSLPKLNFHSNALRNAVYGRSDSPVQYWLRSPWRTAGWRFDVANMLGRNGRHQHYREIWPEIVKSARSANKSCYLFGEHFFDGLALTGPGLLDGVMNYMGFNFPVREWLCCTDNRNFKVPGNAERLDAALSQIRSSLPSQWQLSMFNQLSSHDIPRLSYMLASSEQARNPAEMEKLIIAGTALLFGYPGVPCIYYGDEIGMIGGTDPFNRQPMQWNKERWNTRLLKIYSKLAHARRSLPVLQTGAYKTLMARGDIFCFARILAYDRILVLINKGPNPQQIQLDLWPAGISGEIDFIDLLQDNADKHLQDSTSSKLRSDSYTYKAGDSLDIMLEAGQTRFFYGVAGCLKSPCPDEAGMRE